MTRPNSDGRPSPYVVTIDYFCPQPQLLVDRGEGVGFCGAAGFLRPGFIV